MQFRRRKGAGKSEQNTVNMRIIVVNRIGIGCKMLFIEVQVIVK